MLLFFVLALIGQASAAYWQFSVYPFCNATGSGSSSCSLDYNSTYSGDGITDYLHPYKLTQSQSTYSSSQAIAPSTCIETGGNYIGYNLNAKYKCSSTQSGRIKAYVYVGDDDETYLVQSYDAPANCDDSLRSFSMFVNVSSAKSYYGLSYARVSHKVEFMQEYGSGTSYVEGEGQLFCVKDSEYDKTLNVNGGFSTTFAGSCQNGIGFDVLPVRYASGNYYTDLAFSGGNCFFSGVSSGATVYDISPLKFYLPYADRVDVAFRISSTSSYPSQIRLTNGYDYDETISYTINSGDYTYIFNFYNTSSAVARKFKLIFTQNVNGILFDDLSVSALNISVPTTTTTATPATTTTVEAGDAEISQISVSDLNPTLEQEISIKIKITNTGDNARDFAVGVSIGNGTVICNRDCYTDGKGDYVHTGVIHSGQTVQVERTFKIRKDYFDVGNSYNMYVGVYPSEYLPPSQAYDYKVLSSYISIIPVEQKLDINIMSVKASKPKVHKGDIVDITAYMMNNGSITYNFTIGMSIGLWNANGEYKEIQAPLLPPCNTQCYADDKGDWVYEMIPPNYTDPIKRSFIVPDYFLDDNYFDVAISAYTDLPDRGGKLVSIYYAKNVSKTTTEPSASQVISGQAKSAIDAFLVMASNAFSVSISSAKILFVVFVELLAVYLIYRSNIAGVDNNLAILATVILLTFGFMAIGWLPVVIAIIVIIICGLILYTIIRG